jgi:hypothetical protein
MAAVVTGLLVDSLRRSKKGAKGSSVYESPSVVTGGDFSSVFSSTLYATAKLLMLSL